jgi:hypothetical protein
MEVIQPTNKDIEHPQHLKRHSPTIRLWHWLNAVIITGSLLTVLLNSTLLKTRKNAVLIKAQLADQGVNVTDIRLRDFCYSGYCWNCSSSLIRNLSGVLKKRIINIVS